MADISGTLWENSSDEASMNHAFEAHIVTTLYRDILGLYKVDYGPQGSPFALHSD